MIPSRPSAAKYGLKRDRRKLHVELLHLPPEESRSSKYHPEAIAAAAAVTAAAATAASTDKPSASSRQQVGEMKPKLGALCSPQLSSRLDF
jgi:hypothetical protein